MLRAGGSASQQRPAGGGHAQRDEDGEAEHRVGRTFTLGERDSGSDDRDRESYEGCDDQGRRNRDAVFGLGGFECEPGIAARQFAAAGCRVLGVDPDPRMAGLARQSGLEVEVATFEAWDPAGRVFDAVIAGQAWHWVDPAVGAVKAAQVLRPGGRLAVFWNTFQPPPGLGQAFARVYHQVMPGAPNLPPVKAGPGEAPGLYQAPIELEMLGDWTLRLDLAGPLRDRVVKVLRFEDDRAVPATAPNVSPPQHRH